MWRLLGWLLRPRFDIRLEQSDAPEHRVRILFEHIMVDNHICIYCHDCGSLSEPLVPEEGVLLGARTAHKQAHHSGVRS